MPQKIIKVSVSRFDPYLDKNPGYKTYHVPWCEGMSAMDALDYIYHNLDSTLAYYDHAGCSLGICGQCTAMVNGRPGLLCQTPIKGDVTLDHLSGRKVLRDLVVQKRQTAAKETNETV